VTNILTTNLNGCSRKLRITEQRLIASTLQPKIKQNRGSQLA
jgi:hypothetical protein